MSDLFANVIVDISHENLDRTFSYRVPDSLKEYIAPGERVIIPFGAANREIMGFVLSLSDEVSFDVSKIKDIIRIEHDDSLVESKLIVLAEWMRKRYGSTMINALKTVLPIKKTVRTVEQKTILLKINQEEAKTTLDVYNKKHQVARARLLGELISEKSLDYRLVTGKLNISPATIKFMIEQGVIEVSTQRKYRNTVAEQEELQKIPLNTEQQRIVDEFKSDEDKGLSKTYLIRGITGSGKTEVYMEMIEHVISKGRQAIVLIPEIALTYQTVMRFSKRFGDRVSTLHSRLSAGERYDQFERAKKHEISVMIGPRSALFTPFDNIGLIVIDEEHEHTYKSENMPKYHAREVARKLCDLHGASLVLGSATPSVDSYYAAKQNAYKLFELNKRAVTGSSLPTTHLVDLRKELAEKNRSIFSRELSAAIKDRLEKHEQIMLFLNRRGMAGFISCRACGEVIKCPHCDVSLSRHANGKLICHYCGYEQADIKKCPKCGSEYVMGMRAGTEAVEKEIKKQFPYASVLRMDYDTTRQKGSYDDILSRFANREADILIGTQMIVKGHDFPFVTLMGILIADMSLNANDYRAGERCFQLLVQAAGRAGRADVPGDVIIQTYQPEHYAIVAAMGQNYTDFYEEEIAYRTLVGYPPVGHMLAVLLESEDSKALVLQADALALHIKNDIINICGASSVSVIGPTEATVAKIADVYRRVLYIKSKDENALIKVKDSAELFANEQEIKKVRISFDFDPMNGY